MRLIKYRADLRFKKYQTNAARKHLLKLVLFSSINLVGNRPWRFFEESNTNLRRCLPAAFVWYKKWNCAKPSLGGLWKKATPI